MLEPEVVKAVLPPAAFAVGGGIIGLVLQYLMFPGGRKHRPWFGDLLYAVLRGPTVLWCAAAGLFLALEVLDIDGRLALGIRHTLFVLIVLSISWSVARLTGAIVAHLSRPLRGTLGSATLLVNVARVVVLMLGVLIILQTFGVSVTPALTALGIGGLAIGLALQDTLANFFAGIHILSSRQVRPGDYVQLASGEEGYIQDVTCRWGSAASRSASRSRIRSPISSPEFTSSPRAKCGRATTCSSRAARRATFRTSRGATRRSGSCPTISRSCRTRSSLPRR